MKLSKHAQIFCSIQAITSVALYLIARTGFPTDILQIIFILGCSLFLVNLSVLFRSDESDSALINNTTTLLGIALLMLMIFGEAGSWSNLIRYPLAVTGYFVFVRSLVIFFRKENILFSLLTTGCAFLFALFLCGILLGIHAKPLFLEELFAGIDSWRIDTLYHVANVQMHKTYGIFTTGLDGVKAIPYHYGSHLFYSALSNVFGITPLDAYLILPIAFTAPLFLLSFFLVIEQLRIHFKIHGKTGMLFWFVFFLLFVGFTRNRFYGGGGIIPEYSNMLVGSPILFLSDSFTVSLLFLNLLIALTIRLTGTGMPSSWATTCVAATCTFLFAMASYCKISTVFMLMCVVSYVFVRSKFFTRVKYIVIYVITACAALVFYFLELDVSNGDGGFSLLYHFREAKINFPLFFIIHFIWVWVVLLLFSRAKFFRLKDLFKSSTSLVIEILIVLVFSSLLPAIFLRIGWGQVYYFTEVASWYAGLILLAFLPVVANVDVPVRGQWFTWKTFLIAVGFAYGVNVFYMNIKSYFNLFVGANISTRNAMLVKQLELRAPYQFKTMDYLRKDKILRHEINSPMSSVYFDSASIAPRKRFIDELQLLNSMPASIKKESVVYINFDSVNVNPMVTCYEKPFLIPALTGMASVNGGLSSTCKSLHPWFVGYSFEYYDERQTMTRADMEKRLRRDGFRYLITYNLKRQRFDIIQL